MCTGNVTNPVSERSRADKKGPGILYVVGTPLGNLQDLSPRAGSTLKDVDLIAAEDTRRTQRLLHHLGIRARMISCHKFNEEQRIQKILETLASSKDVALVTDAGTPGLSDPGAKLIKYVRDRGFKVIPVPGPSAITAALSISGMPADTFFFAGFLPSKGPARKRSLERVRDLPCTLVFFEAPHRLIDSLGTMYEVLGDRKILMARELTKIHETIIYSTISGLIDTIGNGPVKGEITLVVEAASAGQSKRLGVQESSMIKKALEFIMTEKSLSLRDAVDLLVDLGPFNKGLVYQLALKVKQKV